LIFKTVRKIEMYIEALYDGNRSIIFIPYFIMINILTNREKKESPKPEKLYTQGEVDALQKENAELLASQNDAPVPAVPTEEPPVSNTEAIAQLVEKSNRILLSISSHAFPIDIFPDTINIEEGRITIIKRRFLSSEIHSIDIKNISNIFINSTIFFSQLVIISTTFEANEIKVRNLRTKEAVFARRIIEGLRTFETNKIDTSAFSTKELIAKLQELSTTKIVM